MPIDCTHTGVEVKISVVIPTLNERALLPQAVESIQRKDVLEIIVCDGGSHDGTQSVARNLECRVLESTMGRGHQLAAGAKAAKGDLLLFLHADSRLTSRCLPQLKSLPDDWHWGCFRHRIDSPEQRFRWIEYGNQLRTRIRSLVYGDQTMWVRRQAYERVGGFPKVPLMEDVRMSEALKQLNRPKILPGPVLISDRHWQRRGVLRTTVRNQLMMGLYRCGCSPDRLAQLYRR